MKSIVIAGVGGQGTLLASVILGVVALENGLDVKLSEIHGMAQRGGSVVSYVRIGDRGEKVLSPVIGEGTADIMLAFEEIEALRWVSLMKPKNAKIYVNAQRILPMPVITGKAEYPTDVGQRLTELFPRAVFINAVSLARQAGSERAVNTVLIGAMAAGTHIEKDKWLDAVKKSVKPAYADINARAFALGYEAAEEKE